MNQEIVLTLQPTGMQQKQLDSYFDEQCKLYSYGVMYINGIIEEAMKKEKMRKILVEVLSASSNRKVKRLYKQFWLLGIRSNLIEKELLKRNRENKNTVDLANLAYQLYMDFLELPVSLTMQLHDKESEPIQVVWNSQYPNSSITYDTVYVKWQDQDIRIRLDENYLAFLQIQESGRYHQLVRGKIQGTWVYRLRIVYPSYIRNLLHSPKETSMVCETELPITNRIRKDYYTEQIQRYFQKIYENHKE